MDPVNGATLISPFVWLLLGHLAGDFLFQTRWMALQKVSNLKALLSHSLIYILFIGLFSLFFGGLHYLSYILIFVVHLVLDRKSPVRWWTERITGSNEEWLLVIVDQVFHIFILVAALYLTAVLV